MGTGVFVLGMDRSGTSATAGLISLLGLRTPPEDDLVRTRETNPTGVLESKSLVKLNRRVLTAVASDERFPVALGPGWENDARLDPLRTEAGDAFRRVFPSSPWVWKARFTALRSPFGEAPCQCSRWWCW